jgi:hypothetical protein
MKKELAKQMAQLELAELMNDPTELEERLEGAVDGWSVKDLKNALDRFLDPMFEAIETRKKPREWDETPGLAALWTVAAKLVKREAVAAAAWTEYKREVREAAVRVRRRQRAQERRYR